MPENELDTHLISDILRCWGEKAREKFSFSWDQYFAVLFPYFMIFIIIIIIIICFVFNFALTLMYRHLVPVLCGHYQLLKKNLVRHFMYKASSLLHRHRGQRTSLKESLFLMV